MPIIVDDEEFTFSCVGAKTKQKYTGKFRAKKSLAMADHLNADRMFRDLLGGQNPAHAGQKAQNIASLVAELSVRLTKAPMWWTEESNGGLALKDENLLGELCDAAMQIEQKALEAETKSADGDKAELRKNQKTADAE